LDLLELSLEYPTAARLGFTAAFFQERVTLIVRAADGVSAAQTFIIANIASECLAFVVIPKLRVFRPGSQMHWVPALRTDRMIVNAKMKEARSVLE
jgi:hypothetical protein